VVYSYGGMSGSSGGGDDAGAGGQQEGDAADFGDHVEFLSILAGVFLAVGFSEPWLAVVDSQAGMSGEGGGGDDAAAGREDQANSLQRLQHFGAPL
jgi:hypothetical protein